MRIECGIVTRVEQGKAMVESSPESGCASCAARGSCMTASGARNKSLWIENILNAKTGDTVSYRIEEKGVVMASLLLYLLPVIFLIGGAVLGTVLAGRIGMEGEKAAALCGLAGFAMAFLIMYIVSRIKSIKTMFSPVMLEILDTSRNDS